MLEVKRLTVEYGKLRVVDELSFSLGENQWLMIVGPNGAGKSSVVKAIAQSVAYGGEVLFRGQNVAAMKSAERAKNIGVLGQSNMSGYGFSVREVVALGRYAYAQGIFSSGSAEDEQSIESALQATGLSAQAGQSVLTLSGGELQRTFLAQVFAQDPQLLILDEPANHLDLLYQKQMFQLIAEWAAQPNRAVISVVHDLSLARAYGSSVLLMNKGKAVAYGQPEQVMSSDNLNAVYDMDVQQWMQSLLEPWS